MYQIFSKTHSLRSLMNVGGPLVLSYTSKKSTYELIRFISKSKKCYFWGRFGTFCGSPDPSGLFFFKKWTSLLFSFYNFIQEIRKNWWVTSGILSYEWRDELRDDWTDEQRRIHGTLPLPRVLNHYLPKCKILNPKLYFLQALKNPVMSHDVTTFWSIKYTIGEKINVTLSDFFPSPSSCSESHMFTSKRKKLWDLHTVATEHWVTVAVIHLNNLNL